MKIGRLIVQYHRMPKYLWPGYKTTAPSYVRFFWLNRRPKGRIPDVFVPATFLFDLHVPKYGTGG